MAEQADLVAENRRLREEVDALRSALRHGQALPLSSEQIYESIFRLSPSIITVTRFEDGTYYDVNEAFCRATGYSRDVACRGTSLSLNLWVNPDDRENVKHLLATDGACSNVEIAFRKGDGTTMYALQSAELVTIGVDRFIIAITTDITDRRRAEATLARERERLSITLQSHSDGVLVVDGAGCVERMNRAACSLVGASESGALGRPAGEVLRVRDPERPEPVDDVVGALLSGVSNLPSSPLVLTCADGSERHVLLHASPIPTSAGVEGAVLVLRDVTVQLRTEEQLRKTARLESLGVLAGGIAHDFNNVLMAIKSNVAFARSMDVPRNERQEALADVEDAVRRGRDLTQQLLTFSRGGAPIKHDAPMGDLLADVTAFVLRGTSVRISLDVSPDIMSVAVDRSQISQVIENLVVNAQQAMPDGGVLRITASNFDVDDRMGLQLPAGRYVRLSFEDDGPGIAAADLPRVFDPFFSTKPGGTGLGLSIVHSVVRRHGGTVVVRSIANGGACFDVYLPATVQTFEQPRVSSGPFRGSERILLMDDDPNVRRAMQRALSLMGYRVDVVVDGREAVTAYERALVGPSPYALAILDLTVVGGTGGKEAAQKLRRIDPQAVIVVSSGYSDEGILADPRAHGFDACLPKPYDESELALVLRRAFSGRSPGPGLPG